MAVATAFSNLQAEEGGLEAMPDKTIRSVESLQRLYGAAVALALYTAVSRTVIITQAGSVTLNFVSLSFFAPFLLTLLPFYHGALRHLDETYIYAEGRAPVLLCDFILLFIEAGLLVWLAFQISDPLAFGKAYVALLLADVIWAFVVLLADKTAFSRIKGWMCINIVTVVLLAVIQYTSLLDRAKPWHLIAIPVLRSFLDYATNWRMFFPPKTSTLAP